MVRQFLYRMHYPAEMKFTWLLFTFLVYSLILGLDPEHEFVNFLGAQESIPSNM